MWQHSVATARDMVRRSHQYTHSQGGSGSGSGSGNPSDEMVRCRRGRALRDRALLEPAEVEMLMRTC